jgi:hypothetical protein
MNITGLVSEPSTDDNQSVVPLSIPSPKLLGLKIFVCIVSILLGLIAGGIVEGISWSASWPDPMGHIGLLVGPFGGIVAAWFWIKIMMRHVNNHANSIEIVVYGTIWGIVVGWLAVVILWFCERYLLPGIISREISREIGDVAQMSIFILGSIGGVVAGLGCSIVLALRTREYRRSGVNQAAEFPNPIPCLKGPTIFVYVVSIFAGLLAGLLTVMHLIHAPQYIRHSIVLFLTLFASVLVGVMAARFWIQRMTPLIRNRDSQTKIVLQGIRWGLRAGWFAAAIYWAILGWLLLLFVSIFEVVIIVLLCIGFFGSIGGLAAGVISGVAWAIWPQPKE